MLSRVNKLFPATIMNRGELTLASACRRPSSLQGAEEESLFKEKS
jgi:hypothetical protein